MSLPLTKGNRTPPSSVSTPGTPVAAAVPAVTRAVLPRGGVAAQRAPTQEPGQPHLPQAEQGPGPAAPHPDSRPPARVARTPEGKAETATRCRLVREPRRRDQPRETKRPSPVLHSKLQFPASLGAKRCGLIRVFFIGPAPGGRRFDWLRVEFVSVGLAPRQWLWL